MNIAFCSKLFLTGQRIFVFYDTGLCHSGRRNNRTGCKEHHHGPHVQPFASKSLLKTNRTSQSIQNSKNKYKHRTQNCGGNRTGVASSNPKCHISKGIYTHRQVFLFLFFCFSFNNYFHFFIIRTSFYERNDQE